MKASGKRMLVSLAVIGLMWALPARADDMTFRLRADVLPKMVAVLGTASAQGPVNRVEAPIVLEPLKWENAQSPASADDAAGPNERPGDLHLLQEPGPAPTAVSQPAAGSPIGKQATQVNVITGLGNVSSENYRPMTGKQRWEYYLNQNFVTVGAYFGPVLSSAIDQINGEPPEWGGGVTGYGKRLASRLGTGIVMGSTQSLGCAILGQEPRYIRSASPRVLSRVGHAFLYSLITYNNEGKVRVALPTLASYYVSSMTTTLWMPERFTALGDGVRDGNRQVILAGLVNQFQEFWPDIKRIVFRRH